jgi:hypothetical protein
VSVEDGALAPHNVNEDQIRASVEVGETFTIKHLIIKIDLQNIIEMKLEEENVAIVSMQKEDEHVIKHVEIDVGDIFILTYNLLPTHPLYLRGWVGFFWQICVCNTFINYGSRTFASPSFSM